jgi:hypothetical protein
MRQVVGLRVQPLATASEKKKKKTYFFLKASSVSHPQIIFCTAIVRILVLSKYRPSILSLSSLKTTLGLPI